MSFHLMKEGAKHQSKGRFTGANATKVQTLNQTYQSTKEETIQITYEKKRLSVGSEKKMKSIWKDELWVLFFLPVCIPNSSVLNNKHIFILNTTSAKHPSCLGNTRKKIVLQKAS